MTRLLLILAAVLSLAAQETPFPADHFCLTGPPADNQPKGHECHCVRVCAADDENGVENESPNCAMYCKRDRCLCHVDKDPCPKPPKA